MSVEMGLYLVSAAGLLVISGDSRIACMTRRGPGQLPPASSSLTWCCCCWWWCWRWCERWGGWRYSLAPAWDACWVAASDVTSPSDTDPPPSPIPILIPIPTPLWSFLAWRGVCRLTTAGQLLKHYPTASHVFFMYKSSHRRRSVALILLNSCSDESFYLSVWIKLQLVTLTLTLDRVILHTVVHHS